MQQRVAVMTGEALYDVYRATHASKARVSCLQIWCSTTRSTFGGREPNLASIAASDDDSEYSTEKQEFMGTSSSSSGKGLNGLTSLASKTRSSKNVPVLPAAPVPKVACREA